MEDDAITQPIGVFAELNHLGRGRVYDLDAKGEIETVLIGCRRHVILESYRRYLSRLRDQQANKPRSGATVRRHKAETV